MDSEARLWSVVEGIPHMIWRAVGRGLWTWSSPQWEDYTGQDSIQSGGYGWLKAVHPDDATAARDAWRVPGARGEYRADLRIRARDGSYRWFQTRGKPIGGCDGTPVEWLGTATNVDELRRCVAEQKMLVNELQHRTRNLLTVVHSVAMQTLRNAADLDDFRERFETRLAALSRVQGLLSVSDEDPITIGRLVTQELNAIAGQRLQTQVVMSGSDAVLRSNSAQTMALAVHELSTNALKYGALSTDHGQLEINWYEHMCEGRRWLCLEWRESGAEVRGGRPKGQQGYGRLLIERALPHQLGARTALTIGQDGLRCTIDLPLEDGQVDHGEH